ncbi:Alpha/beta hydrolase family protein [Luteitalea pratensis]|uniref:Alpha/beta hydrolase family protein n=2 Tax=Luteitalea pratensis TaxID=1855912 RepID=A0A143PUC7_LUTPR|nr:Alpha/beta hydrolase family protein [Luteitalea pratensis]
MTFLRSTTMREPMTARRIIGIVRRVWVTTGGLLLLGMPVYAWWTYAARLPAGALDSDAGVVVERGETLRFIPRESAHDVGLVWVAGCLVAPEAYAPLGHAIAARGFPVIIYGLPWRCAPFPQQRTQAETDLRRLLEVRRPSRWVLGGHSKGATFVVQIAVRPPASLRGLVIAGSTHPRDVDLSGTSLAVAKIVATEDGIAPIDVSESRRRLLPDGVTWHRLEGGNHSQFGWYGTQLGDGTARITRARQHD